MNPWFFAGSLVLCAPSAFAQELTDYRVQSGDTCPSIAQRMYGDVGRIDLIHQNNRLGRLPHRLRPGQILRLPPTATGSRRGADATITFVRNQVNAFTPEQHHASREESLERGHRVGTLDASSAELTFIDEAQLQLGSNTLVVILGRSARRVDAGDSASTRLERGTLRASLAALSGGSAAPQTVTIETPSGSASVGRGTSLVDVDQRATTRLAVHAGNSSIRARGRTVSVNEGFGSRADRGRAPTPPQPLPEAPQWIAGFAPLFLADGDARIRLQGQFARGVGGPAPVVWHVQLARDERFNDLIVDARVPAAVTNLDADVTTGRYFARVSAVDADGFEGRPSSVQRFAVASVTYNRGGPGMLASVRVSEGVFCAMDNQPLRAVTATPWVLSPLQTHVLRCASDAEATRVVDRTFDRADSGFVVVQSRPMVPRYEGNVGQRRVLVRLLDAVGSPIVGASVRAVVQAGFTAEPVIPGDQPGTYETVLRWTGTVPQTQVSFFVDGDQEARATVEVTSSAPPPAAEAPAAPPAPHVGLEASMEANAMITFDGRYRSGLGLALEARARIPAGPGLLLGVRAGYLRFGCVGPQLADPSVICAPASAGGPSAPSLTLGIDAFDFGPVVGGYFARHNGPVTGYFAFVPQWVFVRTAVTRADGTEAIEGLSTVTAAAMVGAQLRIGPGGLFANVGYRGAVAPTRGLGELPIGGLLIAMGYRALF
ncbi:MAG: FecR domain-containing protein [Deltaproteobacteria bacterium]|nr:FecR domain-containing protein [Deltaproteobacteria bacterium]